MPVSETAARIPGWTLIREEGKGNLYRAPDGNVVGAWVYTKAFDYYRKTGVALQTPPGNKWKKTQRISSRKSPENEEQFEELVTEIPVGNDGDSISLELPETKPSTHKPRAGLFSAKELSQGMAILLAIVTTTIAVVTRLPEAQMTEAEIRAVSIPMANIIERSRYNRVIGNIIVDKSDYVALGYALYVYINRVASSARDRRENAGPTQTTGTAPVAANNGFNGAGIGVPLRPTPSGLRNVGS